MAKSNKMRNENVTETEQDGEHNFVLYIQTTFAKDVWVRMWINCVVFGCGVEGGHTRELLFNESVFLKITSLILR